MSQLQSLPLEGSDTSRAEGKDTQENDISTKKIAFGVHKESTLRGRSLWVWHEGGLGV